MDFLQNAFLYIVIIFSAIVHEYAHGWMAYREGDPTAKYAGRLTLNPIPHMDLFGTVLLPLLLLFSPVHMFFGYAKPVPINPNNFRHQRRGLVLVSIAGVIANFLIALILGMIVRFYLAGPMASPLAFIAMVNIWLSLFNLLPVPPLDGSKLLFALISERRSRALDFLQRQGSWFGILIALFLAFTFLPYVAQLIFWLITGINL